jgi:5-methylcytosine-specific restriction endonuclease McrA
MMLDFLLSPTIRQCDQDGELKEWRRPFLFGDLRCGYCLEPVKFPDASAEIISHHDETISYPDERVGVRAVLTHFGCGPGLGYSILLGELASESQADSPCTFPSWIDHLRSKVWFTGDAAADLFEIHKMASRARQKRAADVKAAENQRNMLRAGRTPGTSDNPRSISVRMRTFIFERDDFTCRRCGHKAPDVKLVVDHIVPVAKGGTGHAGNLQTLCRDCNAGKTDHDPHPHDHVVRIAE